ncbi:uncharacterized protein LOC126665640 [Mercurialis annua]|uniref:uncharacterized protein LOC126665640 n=1 Tax=Mercurialis annua TaxID=3986 RepID=UPI0021604A84|nr:uncharacterized protein LOC126665640 [Mercurialis annua]
MDLRVGLVFLLVLGAGWASAARQIVDTEFSHNSMVISDIAIQMKDQEQEEKNQAANEGVGNEKVCSLCEDYASQALDYLSENRTQTKILSVLHQACSGVPTFKHQCVSLMDYYAPLFFTEVLSVQPEALCRKVNLCEEIVFISSKFQEDKCGICHRAVSEVLVKLKNPDTQLEIIELLLKACDSMENHASKCKRMVFEYGPLILTNAEQFLETKDICIMLHACDSPTVAGEEAATVLKADS